MARRDDGGGTFGDWLLSDLIETFNIWLVWATPWLKSDFSLIRQMMVSTQKYMKTWSIQRWGIFNKSVCHIHIFLFAGEFAASDVGFIWAPAGFLNLNVLFVSLCCVVLDWTSQGYVNWLSAGSLVLFSERDHFQRGGKKRRKKKKRTFSCHFKRPSFYESLFPPSTLVVKSARIYFYPSINAFLNLSIFLWMTWCTARTGAKYLDFNLSCSLSSLIWMFGAALQIIH